MRELLIGMLNFLGLAWWVEIVTDNPKCTYYFGPFLNKKEAEAAQGGYIEDLEDEDAQGIGVTIKRFKPNNLTICDDLGKSTDFEGIATFSSQLS
ncbi:MAG: DUF1816 domain-containing protein [Xenococcaceae cyanobacterium]